MRIRAVLAGTAVLAVTLAGCGETPGSGSGTTGSQASQSQSQPVQSQSQPQSQSSNQSGQPNPTGQPSQSTQTGTTPATTQTSAAPNALMPNTSYSKAAKAYAYPAKDVQRWLENGSSAPRYPKKKIAFLTFDDGPDGDTTRANLATMKRLGVHGTYFDVGTMLTGPEASALQRQKIAEGHSVCVHSNKHNYEYLYPGRRANATHVVADYKKMVTKLQAILGSDYASPCFRYPGGHMSWKNTSSSDAALAKQGAAWVDWNVMTGDAEPKRVRPTTPSGAVRFMQKQINSLSGQKHVLVILVHDTKSITRKALPQIITSLKQSGYEFGVIG